jgi:hypothetical protein
MLAATAGIGKRRTVSCGKFVSVLLCGILRILFILRSIGEEEAVFPPVSRTACSSLRSE